jgi:hypothetical protein
VTLYDIQTLTGTAGFGYRAFPKTVFFGEAYYGQTRTDPNDPRLTDNPRLDAIGGYIGARGNFTEKLSGMAKAGYEHREFADGSDSSGDPVVDLSVTQRFSEKRGLSLTYSHLSAASVQYSRQTYTADLIGLRFYQVLGPRRKWQANIGANYGLYEYDRGSVSGDRQYDYLRGSVSLVYQIQRWLGAQVGYEHERVIGDSPAVIDYTVNRVTLRVAIGY